MNNRKAGKLSGDEKGKIPMSFYLSSEMVEKIDECLFNTKRRLPIGKRPKLKKSVFCEIALRIAIEEYNKKGEESSLWREIYELFNE